MVVARVFQALSDRTRLRILDLVGKDPMSVGAMVEMLGAPQPLVSRHLRVLKEAGLVAGSRSGKKVFYGINPGRLAEAAAFLAKLGGAGRVSDKESPAGRKRRVGGKQPAGARRRTGGRKKSRPKDFVVRKPSSDMDDFLL
jgi:DNA-binding transcriptional ArsR family regulator